MSEIIGSILMFQKLDEYYEINYSTGEVARLHILNSHVVRFYLSPNGEFKEYPDPVNPDDTAKITAKPMKEYGLEAFKTSTLETTDDTHTVDTKKIQLSFDILTGTMKVYDKRTEKDAFTEMLPLHYIGGSATQTLEQRKNEFCFGGGMQNGRFTHKDTIIKIANTNEWNDGGVTSPCPFFWSTYGYGVLRNTWQPGIYDFGKSMPGLITSTHKGAEFDAFFFINHRPVDLLNDYYELTGYPIFMPEYAFYEAHLDAFNRDYWVEVSSDEPRAILFEDGKYYKSYKPKDMKDQTGILESLNGEKDNYQFSARGMLDRYRSKDIPLGWFVPNDGYGCGYGQTDTFEGDLNNLKEFVKYSKSLGVEVALWTESNLHPADPDHPKKGERDLAKEVGEAGVVALKCDVAWIGDGYSFGLTAVEDASDIFINESKGKSRPFIIMVDGWAGTQRHAGIWSGDQKGGLWEYIRFHIPTYIGSGLSGLPVIGSDMDGIYAGSKQAKDVNVRDYQWKAFTPLQLNMDGWGNIPKYPFAFDEDATDINRAYLKLKSSLLPYNYTIGHESTKGLPMVRAMFLEFPDEILAHTTASQYQYMWGPSFLVAPIYNQDSIDGTSVRNQIFLPDKNQIWIDFFTGERYKGGKVLNNVMCPFWKIPVFIKSGSIIPMVQPNNNPRQILRDDRIIMLYPGGEVSFNIYEDDGLTSNYKQGHYAETEIVMIGPNKDGKVYVNINKTKGNYKEMVPQRSTNIRLMTTKEPTEIILAVNGESVELTKVNSDKEFIENDNVYFYKEDFSVNPYLNRLASTDILQPALLIKVKKMDVSLNEIQLKIKGFEDIRENFGCLKENQALVAPKSLQVVANKTTSNSVSLQWEIASEANYYEIDMDGSIYTNIKTNSFTIKDLNSESRYTFKIRVVVNDEVSSWSHSVEEITKEEPWKHAIKNVIVSM